MQRLRAAAVLVAFAAGSGGIAAAAPDADSPRRVLPFAELTGGAPLTLPVDMSAFAPRNASRAPINRFVGRLVLKVSGPASVQVLRDGFGDFDSKDSPARRLPAFDYEFVQSGNALIPVRRGAIPSDSPEWEFILEPGRVWDEAGDQGYTRASIPFALEERNANCMHNGVLGFLFKSDGTISDAVYEIGSETCAYAEFNMWGRAAARYIPARVSNAAAIAAGYDRENAHRLPTKPISELAKDFPGVDPSRFGSPDEINTADMTTYGLGVKGVNYVGACNTRFGAYPFCSELTLPSYSLAKSIFGGLAGMRLSLRYPGVMREPIGPYVPACAAAGTWNDVTFADALGMATGHYISTDDQADEAAPDVKAFFLDDTHAARIRFACTHYPSKEAPGARWVYHTADAYILGTALSAFYRGKTKPDSDLYSDILVEPIWHELHLDPAIDVARRSYDATAQPFTGWGLTLHSDDVAKLAGFINVDHGAVDGAQLVDREMLDAAMQHDPHDPGLSAAYADLRYKNGFWAWNAQKALGCAGPTWIPFMSGFGGIIVALLPNGVTYYYFSDGGKYAWAQAAREAVKISPICTEATHDR